MRSMKFVGLGALTLLSLLGCNNGQPRLYRVAVDATPIRTIGTPSCFRNNNLPPGRGNRTEQNYRQEDEWVIWSGVEQVEYLDMGTQAFDLGESPTIRVTDLIEGTDKSFSALRSENKPIADQWTEARQTSISVVFKDYSFSPTGAIALNSQYACIKQRVGCPGNEGTPQDLAPPDAASCTASLNFVARKIDAQQITAYNNNP